jgi:hypothetical protein
MVLGAGRLVIGRSRLHMAFAFAGGVTPRLITEATINHSRSLSKPKSDIGAEASRGRAEGRRQTFA